MTKNGKNFKMEKIYIFWWKIAIYLSLGLQAQATGEASSPQKRTSSISNHEISFFVGNFCPSRIRIKINADPEPSLT